MSYTKRLEKMLSLLTEDSLKDDSLDLDIAQSAHVIKTLRKIAKTNPELIKKALGLE